MAGAEWNKLKSGAIAIGALAAIVLTTMAVIQSYKDTNKVDNTTAGYFMTGVALFGSFVGVLILALIGKVIYNMFSSDK